MKHRSLTLVIHGESGAGKSWMADTAPGPRLVFDVEGGVRFTPSNKIQWDPRGPLPVADGTWDTAVITVSDMDELMRGYSWLTSGQPHPFKSVIIDSLTEAQQRFKDRLVAPGEQMKLQEWGELVDRTVRLIRAFRDLAMQPGGIEVVVFVCGSAERGQEHAVVRPMLQGSAAEKVGYYVDVMGYLDWGYAEDGEAERRMQFVQLNSVAAKDRTGKLGKTMDDPSVPAMLDAIYGREDS